MRALGLVLLFAWLGMAGLRTLSSTAHADERAEHERIVNRASRTFADALGRLDRMSFEYRAMPQIGPLPLNQGQAAFAAGWPAAAKPSITPWTATAWSTKVTAELSRWNHALPRKQSELVRRVTRSPGALLDIDQDLAAYRAVRPTASAEFSSTRGNFLWWPLSGRLTLSPGAIKQGRRPQSGYFAMPTVLAMEGRLRSCHVSVTHHASPEVRTIRVVDTRSTPNQTFVYRVDRRLDWLPTRCAHHRGGQLVRIARFEWMRIKGIGWFLAAVGRMTVRGNSAYLRMACLSNPKSAVRTLPGVQVPVGTVVADTRATPTVVRSLQGPADVRPAWSPYFALGPKLPIPASVRQGLAPLPGTGPAPVRGGGR